MIGKRAKILSSDHVEDLLVFARQTRHPIRNQVLVLLSVKAGLRAGEIANLTWSMLAEPTGQIGTSLNCKTAPPRKAVVESFQFTQTCARLWSSWQGSPLYWTVRLFSPSAVAQ